LYWQGCTRQGSESPVSVIDEVRSGLILDDVFFQIVNNIDFQRDTLETLFSYPDILSHKDEFEDYHIYLFSFLANFLIFMYDSPTGCDRLQSFEYPLLQVLTIQIKNLVDYIYTMHSESKPYLGLRVDVCQKLIGCIVIIMDKIEDPQKLQRYLHFCDAGTWNKIINALDYIYKTELAFMPDLIELTSKFYCVPVVQLETKEQENNFEEFLKMLIAIMSKSTDIKAIINSVDALINIFAEDDLDSYFVKYEIFKILSSGLNSFMQQTKEYADRLEAENSDLQEIDHVSEVRCNLKGFLDYKLEHTKF